MPMRGFEFGQPAAIAVIGTIIPAASYSVPAGRKIHAIYSGDADVVDLRLQVSYDGGTSWVEMNSFTPGAAWAGVQHRWEVVPMIGAAPVTSVRFRNGGANDISGVYALYTDL